MSSMAQAAASTSSSTRPTACPVANTSAGRMRLPPPKTLYRIASCRRVGVTSTGARRAESAASMRDCHDSSCAAKAPRFVGSAWVCRIPKTLLTREYPTCARPPRPRPCVNLPTGSLWAGRMPALGSATRALDVGERHSGHRSARPPIPIRVRNGEIGSHRACEAGAQKSRLQRLKRVRERIVDRRTLETAMSHAVVAGGIATHPVLVPLGVFHQGFERGRIALVRQQVAGSLPAEQVIGRCAPGRALIGLVTRQEVQKQAGVIEGPAAGRAPRTLGAAAFEDFAEQALAGAASEEDILPRGMMIAVARRDHDALDPESHRLIEERRDVIRILSAEERAVDRDPEAFAAGETNCSDCLVEHPFLADGLVMPLTAAVQMDGESQIRRGRVLVDVPG